MKSNQEIESDKPEHTNRLIHESSPYLSHHAHNPVDWYPWGEEAFARAKRENKPILLSVGYRACHWCNVMARESFEDEAIAQLMNDNFISIKVDREERPDLDAIYMNAVQMMTGSGGWPMTVFLTPEGRPFYGGTYFPPADRYGMPGFPRVLISVAEAYRTRRDEIENQAEGMLSELKRLNRVVAPKGESEGGLSYEIADHAANHLLRTLDPVYGGFGNKPKFPPSMSLQFLLRHYHRTKEAGALNAVELTLKKMASGGMYDQLGGGFHRYSVDERWLVPHFEKMLYDNALLSRVYAEAFLATGDEFYKRIAVETLDYVAREMTDRNGGFYSTQDADSEGEEGKFFVWTPEEVVELLGAEDARLFNRYFDVSEMGNFEGHSILHIDEDIDVIARLMRVSRERLIEAVERGKRILFEAREERVKPYRDEKILTAWNGLMMRSFAEASRAFDRDDYLQIAIRNADFLLTRLRRDGRLLRAHKDGESKLNAYLEDYAYLIDGLLSLYEASFDLNWFVEARALTEKMVAEFWDAEAGGFFFTSADHETLITRTKDFYDNATPAGNSAAAGALARLSLLTGENHYREMAETIIRLMKPTMTRAPGAFGHLLSALDLLLASPYEIAVVGAPDAEETRAMVNVIFKRYLPNKVVAFAPEADSTASRTIKLLDGRDRIDGQSAAYVCRNFYCETPLTSAAGLEEALRRG
ncbi:MAG TPA: thioredoxin domain-containing protein [Blastocatellia bacterium]|nr:thioredoxin domain-containing protein [Blastocatellia bacterium]